MNVKTFIFERNGYKVYRVSVHGYSYFIVEGNGKRFIRKGMTAVEKLVS